MAIEIKNKNQVILYTVFAVGILLRIFKLGSQSVWIDEFITAGFAADKNLLYVTLDSLANNPHPPLFFILEHLICSLIGYSEISIRLLPLCFGIISMFVFYKLVRMFFSEQISLIAVFLFCISPYQVYYSQEARNYTMFLMVSMLMMYYFIISIKYNSFVFGKFVLWSIIGIYTHTFSLLLLLIMNSLIFTVYKEEIRLNLWIKAQAIIAIFFLPICIFYIKGFSGQEYYHNVGMLLAPMHTIKNYIFGITIGWNIFTIAAFIAAIYIMMVGVFTYRQKHSKILQIMLWVTALFILTPWLISLLMSKPIYSERLFILVSALVLIILAVGISYLSDYGIALAVAVILAINCTALFNYYFNEKYQKSDYKDQFLQIEKQWKEGDAIVHSFVSSYASFEFYNRIMYKTNYENRMLGEIPEFKGSGIKMKIREMWRQFKEDILLKKLNIDIYAGYDKNTLPSAEAMELMKNYSRIWFIRDNKIGEKQVWLPMGYIWNSNIELGEPPDVEQIPWVKKYFKVEKQEHFYTDDIFLLEAK